MRELPHRKGVEKEHLPRERGIDAAVVASPRWDYHEPVERDLLGCAYEAVFRVPFGRTVAVLRDVARKRLYPADVYLGGVSREEARGVDELACDDPLRGEVLSRLRRRCFRGCAAGAWCAALAEDRAWVERKSQRVCAAVVVRLGVEMSDAGEKPC